MNNIEITENSYLHEQTLRLSDDRKHYRAFIGIGFMNSRGEISRGIPFDFLIPVLSIVKLKQTLQRQGKELKTDIFLGDINAYCQLREQESSPEIIKSRDAEIKAAVLAAEEQLGTVLRNVGLHNDVRIVRGSSLCRTGDYKRFSGNIEINDNGNLTGYAREQMLVMAKYKQDGCDFRLSWVKSLSDPARRDERYFDDLYREVMNEEPIQSIYIKSGMKTTGIGIPYSFYDSERNERLTLDAGQDTGHIGQVLASGKKLRAHCLGLMQSLNPEVTADNLAENIGKMLKTINKKPQTVLTYTAMNIRRSYE